MNTAHLARAENELLASPFEDKLGFVFREHVRGAVVLLRQLLLPLHYFAREANDHVVLIGLSVNRDGAKCGAFDLHGSDPCSSLRTKTPAQQTSLLSTFVAVRTLGSHRSPDPDGSTPFCPSTQLYLYTYRHQDGTRCKSPKRSSFPRLSVPRGSLWSMRSNIARWLCSTIAGPVCADHLNPVKSTFAWEKNSSRLRIVKNACLGCVRTGVFRMLRTGPFHPLGPRAEDA